MRPALLISVLSVAALGLFGWVKLESQRTNRPEVEETSADEESWLFVG